MDSPLSEQSLNGRIGAAIRRAVVELPKDYEMTVEVGRGAAIVALWVPPVSDEEGGRRVDDFFGKDIAEQIENAVGVAVKQVDGCVNLCHHDNALLTIKE